MAHWRSTVCTSATLITAVIIAACSGSWKAAPSEPIQPQRESTSATNPTAASGALLYVSDPQRHAVYVYTYPRGELVGLLRSVRYPQGLCVNEKTGSIWVIDTVNDNIVEFAHGGTKPIATLPVPGVGPNDCAVDSANGDLAVTTSATDDPGSVVVFKNGRLPSKAYIDLKLYSPAFAAYDDNGNLFVDGYTFGRVPFAYAELPRGSEKLTNIKLTGGTLSYPGGVQYAAGKVAIGDYELPVIYQVVGASIVGSTLLDGSCYLSGFFIEGEKLIVPNDCGSGGEVAIYNYPAGGAPIKRISGLNRPFAAVISQ